MSQEKFINQNDKYLPLKSIMKNEVKEQVLPHLEAIATIMGMSKINDCFYYGKNKTLFKVTNYGFVLAGLKDFDNPKHPNYISKSYSLLLPR